MIIGSFACVGLSRHQEDAAPYGAVLFYYYLLLLYPIIPFAMPVVLLSLGSSAPFLYLMCDYCPCRLCWSCSPDLSGACCFGPALLAEHLFRWWKNSD